MQVALTESESGTDEESGEESDEEGLKRELYEEKTGLAEEKKVWAHWQLAWVWAGKQKEAEPTAAPESWYGSTEEEEEREDEEEDDEEKEEVV